MPLISRKEYAELCGDRLDAINVWIKRGKINLVPGNKKLIDTDDVINVTFISDRQLFNAAKEMGASMPKPATNSISALKVSKNEIKKPKSVTKIPKKVTKLIEIDDVKKRGRPKKEMESRAKPPEKVKSEPKASKKSSVNLSKPAEIRQKERVLAEQNTLSKLRVDQDMQKKGLEIENLELAKQQKLLQLNKSAGNLLPVDLVKGVLKRHGDTFFKSFEKSIERFIAIIAGSDQEVYVKYLATLKENLSKTIVDAGKQADAEILILVNDYSQTLARGQKKI